MADKTFTEWYASNPITIDPRDIFPLTENPDTTPETGAAKISQLMRDYYKISVTVSLNDLTVALKHLDGTDPSTERPLYFKIGDSVRAVTTATSFTLAYGTNWFNSGGTFLGTMEIDYFTYLVWDSNSSVVAITASRLPFGRTVNATDFSATTTNQAYLVNYSNFTVGDDLVNIGRFAATLSLSGTGHLWTVPTFTSRNLVNRPTFETRKLSWNVTVANGGITSGAGTPTTVTASCYYKISSDMVFVSVVVSVTTVGTATGNMFIAAPIIPVQATALSAAENLVTGYTCNANFQTTPRIAAVRYDAATLWVNGYNVLASGWAQLI